MLQLSPQKNISGLDQASWNNLHGSQHPFAAHGFLSGLEKHQCLRERWGWQASPVLLHANGDLIAAASAYIKTNSHGEFVFDHAWAHAYARSGHEYYPKLLIATPYTPVTGPRLLASDDIGREKLIELIEQKVGYETLSSAHINFLPESETRSFPDYWLARCDVQFHWQNNAGWESFDDFLAALNRKKRKNIQQERQQVLKAGITVRYVPGHQASEEDTALMHSFYCHTQMEKGNHPALTLDFFRYLNQSMPDSVVLFMAEKNGRAVAGAYCLRSDTTLYGRYWGANETIAGLHFETCYYQGIEYCLREGLRYFEPGAQGEHKIARGFLPVLTHSRHFLADTPFSAALQTWCQQERQHVLQYRDDVLLHSPYRHVD